MVVPFAVPSPACPQSVDIDRFRSTLSENVVMDSDSWGGALEGKDAGAQIIQGYVDAFAPTLTIEQEVASGDTVVLVYSYNGTHKGEFAGVAPTGNTVTGRVIVVSQFKDGLVEQQLTAFNNATLLAQIGVEIPVGAETAN